MKVLSDLKPTSEKYEPPQATRLSDARTAVGAACIPGTRPDNPGSNCTNGNRPTRNCDVGSFPLHR
jgi:hypothetical protein